MSAYRREFVETKIYVFLIKEDELLEKHNEIWEKVSKIVSKKNSVVTLCTVKTI